MAATSSGIGAVLSTSAAAPRRCAAAAYSACANAVSTTTAGRRAGVAMALEELEPGLLPEADVQEQHVHERRVEERLGQVERRRRSRDLDPRVLAEQRRHAVADDGVVVHDRHADPAGLGRHVAAARAPSAAGLSAPRGPDDADPRPALGPVGDRQLGPELRRALRHGEEPEVAGAGRPREGVLADAGTAVVDLELGPSQTRRGGAP